MVIQEPPLHSCLLQKVLLINLIIIKIRSKKRFFVEKKTGNFSKTGSRYWASRNSKKLWRQFVKNFRNFWKTNFRDKVLKTSKYFLRNLRILISSSRHLITKNFLKNRLYAIYDPMMAWREKYNLQPKRDWISWIQTAYQFTESTKSTL